MVVQQLWGELQKSDQDIVTQNLVTLAKNNDSAAIFVARSLSRKVDLPNEIKAFIAHRLLAACEKDWRAATALAATLSVLLERSEKILLAKFLLERSGRNPECATAVLCLDEVLEPGQRLQLEQDLQLHAMADGCQE